VTAGRLQSSPFSGNKAGGDRYNPIAAPMPGVTFAGWILGLVRGTGGTGGTGRLTCARVHVPKVRIDRLHIAKSCIGLALAT